MIASVNLGSLNEAMHDVFICHSAKDKGVADAVCKALEARGIRCWIAPRDITSGANDGAAITGAIANTRITLLVFSSNANTSTQVGRELELTASAGRPILPLRIEDVSISDDLRYFLATCHWFDAMPPPVAQHTDRLAQSVRRLLSESKIRPDHPPPQAELRIRESQTGPEDLIDVDEPSPHGMPDGPGEVNDPYRKWILAGGGIAMVILVGFAMATSFALRGPGGGAGQEASEALHRGIRLLNQGAIDKGMAAFGKAIRLNPQLTGAYVNRGKAKRVQGDYQAAIADFTEAIRTDASCLPAYALRAQAYDVKKDYERAISDFTQMIRLKPTDANGYNYRGQTYMHKGDYARALGDFTKVLELKPDHAFAYRFRGECHAHAGMIAKAIKDYSRTIDLKPRTASQYYVASSYYLRGQAYAKVGNALRAQSDLKKAISVDPNIAKKLPASD